MAAIYSHTTYDSEDAWNGHTIRIVIPAALITASASNFVIKFTHTGSNWAFSKVYIGHAAAAGDAYDFDGTQVQVLFSGNAGATVTAGGIVSDDIVYALDETKDLVLSVYLGSSTSVPLNMSLDGETQYYKAGDDAATTDATGYTAQGARVEMITAISDNLILAADPVVVTGTILGVWNINVYADPIVLTLIQRGNLSHTPRADRNPELDSKFDCSLIGNDGNEIGKFTLTTTITGTWLNVGVSASPITITVSPLCDEGITGGMFSTSALISISLTIGSGGSYTVPQMTIGSIMRNFVKWSNIGSLSFTVGKDNVAGERPVDWKGWIYALKKLGSKVVVYGQNGISWLIPSGVVYGLQNVYGIGLKGKHAVCGTEHEHFFIDAGGYLHRLAESIERLGYSEFLSSLLSTVVMTLDEQNKLIYISDGVSGYIYSIQDKSLGAGPYNITGMGIQSGTTHIAASATISTPACSIVTDIYDLGTRKGKTINSIEIGTDQTEDLYAAIDWRVEKDAAFSSTAWGKVNPNGIAIIPCYGVEFRFKIQLLTREDIKIDYIKVNGMLHNYSYLDSFQKA